MPTIKVLPHPQRCPQGALFEAKPGDNLIELLLDQDIAIMSHAPAGPTLFPPLRLLHLRLPQLLLRLKRPRVTASLMMRLAHHPLLPLPHLPPALKSLWPSLLWPSLPLVQKSLKRQPWKPRPFASRWKRSTN